MLAARVSAARDVDAQPADVGEAFGFESFADRLGQATRLRDGEVASVGAGARHDVAHQLGTRLRHADLGEAVVERGQLRLVEIAEHEVLAIAEAHGGVELALDRPKGTELVGRDVAQLGPGVGGHGLVGCAPHDVGVEPTIAVALAHERDRDLIGTHRGKPVPHRGRCDAVGSPGGRVAETLHFFGYTARP